LPGNEFISPEAGRIVKQVARKIGKLRDELQDTLSQLKSDVKRRSLFNKDEAAIKKAIRKQWHHERKKRVDTLQKDFEPLIYRYFGLTEQEITLVEDTIRVCVRSSTPTTWRSAKTVTLDPLEDTMVEPYRTQGLVAYADTLTTTLNTWAQTEGSNHRVRADGGTDHQTGLAMVTLSLSRTEEAYHQKSLSRRLAKVLKESHKQASRRHGALLYERDILIFQGEQIHIVRPNILLNWTRTAALNDAARIYGQIALGPKES
jgi:hypothetical protein